MSYVMKYFTLREFERSATAEERGIDNTIPHVGEINIRKLVEKILDPAREKFGKGIVVTSGYRCQQLNEVLVETSGASPTSLHRFGMAADIIALGGKDHEELLQIFKKLPCYELIVYRSVRNPDRIIRFHVAYKEGATSRTMFSKFV